MSHDNRKDEQLAAMTDAILSNQTFDPSTDDERLGEVVIALQQLIEPSERPPIMLEDRLKLALNKEWQLRSAASSSRGALPRRYFMAAAGIAAVFVAIIVLSLTTQVNGDVVTGTAVGGASDSSLVILFATLGLVFVGALAYAFWRRR